MDLDDRELLNLCIESPDLPICNDEIFWKERLNRVFGERDKTDNKTWKQFYLKLIYYTDKNKFRNESASLNDAIEKKEKDIILYLLKTPEIERWTLSKNYLKLFQILDEFQIDNYLLSLKTRDMIDLCVRLENQCGDRFWKKAYNKHFAAMDNSNVSPVNLNDLQSPVNLINWKETFYNKFVDQMFETYEKKPKYIDIPSGQIPLIPKFDYRKQQDEITTEKLGIIFCHGHAHRPPIIPSEVDKNTKWILVDIDEKTKPDVIGSYKSWKTINKLGLQKYDYVATYYCPIAYEPIDFISNVRWLLKSNGILYIIPNGLINKQEFLRKQILLRLISENFGYKNFEELPNVTKLIAE